MAEILFALDREHFQTLKKGEIGRLWNYFNFNVEIRAYLSINRFTKFRLIGDTNIVIGELPRTFGEI